MKVSMDTPEGRIAYCDAKTEEGFSISTSLKKLWRWTGEEELAVLKELGLSITWLRRTMNNGYAYSSQEIEGLLKKLNPEGRPELLEDFMYLYSYWNYNSDKEAAKWTRLGEELNIEAKTAINSLVFYQSGYWYFLDETFDRSLPFNSKEEAFAGLREYCSEVLGVRESNMV